jgi:cytochrome d ubiquinol oxidase subunit I
MQVIIDSLAVARWQFAMTTIYHFFFVPLTLGLSILVAIMETAYVRTGDEVYKRMTKFWGKLFLINFAIGVVTGIALEFQFGMNWSEYSRFVGDIFGVPLAIEALLAFFLESTFLGIWIFGWDKLSKGLHAAVMWLVAMGSTISAFWILVANSFMQNPVGYTINDGRAEMTDFLALITNPHVWVQFPHVLAAGVTTAAFFVLGISAYHLRKKGLSRSALRGVRHAHVPNGTAPGGTGSSSPDQLGLDVEPFRRSLRMAVIYALIGTVLVILVGHSQTQHMAQTQPMKLAAAEALWNSENPASFSLLTISNESERRDVVDFRIPGVLSFLTYNRFQGEVKGINQLQAEYEQTFGLGDYVPPVAISYWTFRIMVGAGFLMLALVLYGLYLVLKDKYEGKTWYLRVLGWAIALPYIANTTGWLFAEIGRQPWIVFGLQLTADGVSPAVPGGAVLLTFVGFTLIYGALMVADVYLLNKYARGESEPERPEEMLAPSGAG